MRIAAALTSALAFMASAPTPSHAFQSENTLRIGAMWAITGGVALTGKGALNLSKFAVEEINANGGVNVGGKVVKLELYAYDEACKEQEGMALLSRLKDVDKVLFYLGPTCSSALRNRSSTRCRRSSTIPTIKARSLFLPTRQASSVLQRSRRGFSAIPSTSPPCTSSS